VEGRREARERALELLYEADAKTTTATAVIDGLPVDPDSYASAIAIGVDEHVAELDELLQRHVQGWTIDRMAVLDRTLLRMAAYELAYEPSVPVAVVISEAVELAKQYSTEESGRFVNGVLGSVAKEVRRDG
jgi:N utilization substance protein B